MKNVKKWVSVVALVLQLGILVPSYADSINFLINRYFFDQL